MNVRPDEGEKWMNNTLRLCMTEPAYFYVQLFSATGSLAEQGRISPDLPLWLRGETVKALNEALNDPKRALSNPVIMTVGRVALHETVYGDRDTARLVHRPAYRWMLNARGGIRAMGLPELTVQLMDWGDRVMTALLGPPDDNGYLLLDGDQRFEPEVVNEYKPGTVKLLNGGT